MSSLKQVALLGLICLLLACSAVQLQALNHEPDRTISDEMLAAAATIPRETLEKLANLTQDESSGVWFLVPSNSSGDVQVNNANFELFKLNTNQLFDLGARPQQDWARRLDSIAGSLSPETQLARSRPETNSQLERPSTSRGARKLGLFSNVLHKPKVSPLYLVNGTVCRFVNSQPICTTLSTTGLFRGTPTQGFLTNQNQNQQNGFLSNLNGNTNTNNNNNNNNNNQQQQQFPNARQVSPPQNNFLQGGGNFQQGGGGGGFSQNLNIPNQQQQFRPAALMDDEAQAVNLTAKSSKTAELSQQPATGGQRAAKPTTQSFTIVQRRPINLLSLARPFRPSRS